MQFIRQYATLLLILLLTFFSCRKESFYSGQDAILKFSNDTITFDTIFTGIGTVTKKLMVYNPYSKTIKITNIQLAGNSISPFIININGKPVNSLNNVEIYSKDSLYIFIQVFINLTGQNLPLLFHDSLIFNVNGNIQDVDLVAYGQDVHWVKNELIKTTTWEADKPYLIYGDVIIDSLETLTINKGVSVYCHKQANLKVKGSLVINGSFEQPAVFRGDRLEKDYNDIPAQWGGISFLPGSKNNILNWVILENGITGIQVGKYNDFSKPNIELSNVIVRNMSYGSLVAIGAVIKASNCIMANAGTYTCGLIGGGDYEFYHCTLVNYFGKYLGAERELGYPALYISNYYPDPEHPDNDIITGLTKADFYNTIVYGSNSNEIKLDSKAADFLYKFDHCLLRSEEYHDSLKFPLFTNNIWNKDPKFIKPDSMKFELDTLSAAKDHGSISIGNLFPLDLKNIDRTKDAGPDIGAYERVE
jgi:hypothetical protein